MPKNSNNKNNSLNKNYFHVLDDSFKIRKKNFSRNYIFSKNIDDFEFMNQKNVHNENNVTLPSKKISKKYNSYSNIYTLNNSPINYLLKNKKTINNIKINNLQMLHKNFRMRNILEGNNLSKKINISLERNNSKNNKEENKTIKNKNNILENKEDKINKIRLNYTSEKNRNMIFSNNKSSTNIKYSNYNSYVNRLNEKYRYNNDINYKNNNYISNKPNYVYNNSYLNNKNKMSYNNIKLIHNYSQKTKENYYNYKSKDLLYPFEKKKRNRSIFPVNPFDSINCIKVNNFFK